MRRSITLLAAGLALLLSACQSTLPEASPAADKAAIRAMLAAQDAAWNEGDIDAFMQGYWQSPRLRFASGGDVTRGYETTLNRYKARYDSPGAMGTLSFDDLEINLLSPDAAVVHGAWQLARETDTPGGLFTLVLRRIDGEWKIVSDTTTSARQSG
ncbi:nuclear transport factor 2 family protein [Henriciella sp.]|uniref:YybH family protein n=1 Tax=Henriciella sp. TaxID=1968823 RepID=UPI002608F389|nr:nuclear transport factor 2 family protein [Henriciella sp.]